MFEEKSMMQRSETGARWRLRVPLTGSRHRDAV